MNKPLITFSVTSYNQEDYIKEAILGAFSQGYAPLEIILSDDCSIDDSFKIMRQLAEEYTGPHRILLNKNNETLGIAAHTNKIIEMAHGEIIVFADGDDVSLPNRSLRSYEIISKNNDCKYLNFGIKRFYNKIMAVNDTELKSYSVDKYFLDQLDLLRDFPVSGATTLVKSNYELFGPLDKDTPVQDSPIQLRYLLAGSIYKCNEPQIYYRIHADNLAASDNKYRLDFNQIHNQYIKDLNKALEMNLIDNERYYPIKQSLERKLDHKLILTRFHKSNNKLNFYFSQIFISDLFSLKAKLIYLLRCFGINYR